LADGWNKYRPVIGGMFVKPDFEPRPLRRWQLTQAAAAPSMRRPPSRMASRGAPEGSTPWRKIASPGSVEIALPAGPAGTASNVMEHAASSARKPAFHLRRLPCRGVTARLRCY
jgi:hypothetical protein